MKIKEKNGITHYSDYEIDKALCQYERGVSFYEYFKCKAQRFKYGASAYFTMIKKELEHYEQTDWNNLIETRQLAVPDVCAILEGINEIKKTLDLLPPQSTKTKAEILKEQLSQYGFFELEKVQVLSEQSRFSLIEKISENGLPYAIAMFDYLQFIQFLKTNYFDAGSQMYKEVSKWFNSDKDGRAIKGNINSLLEYTTENKNRYTAFKHKEKVITYYQELK